MTQVADELLGARVLIERVPQRPSGNRSVRVSFGGGDAVVRLGRMGAVHVSADGSQVRASIDPALDDSLLAAHLFGTVLAVVAAQQGDFALHASTVKVGTTGVAIGGRSGAGKSTLSLALRRRGAALVTDDVTAVGLGAGGAVVRSTGRPLHMWQRTADLLDLDTAGLSPCSPAVAKFDMPFDAPDQVPLHVIVLLQPHDGGLAMEPLSPSTAAMALLQEVYRPHLLTAAQYPARLAWAGRLAKSTLVVRLRRPRSEPPLDESVQALEELAASTHCPV